MSSDKDKDTHETVVELVDNLYLVQDANWPAHILAHDYYDALRKWQRWVIDSADDIEDTTRPPEPAGITLVADADYDTILR